MTTSPWPALPLEEWRSTYDTLHRWTQIVGKVRMALSPHVNHWWEVPLYVTARGLTTSPMPYGDRAFEIDFDFIDHNLAVRESGGATKFVPLYPRSVADFYTEMMAVLHAMRIDVKIWPVPVEGLGSIPFPEDKANASYDPEYVRRLHRILVEVDAAFKEFRGRFLGKVSPVHFFWGSFDLAVTRFSGRRAPEREGADSITRDAYSHECSSVGFWPGNNVTAGPAFYAYASPEPEGYAAAPHRPAAAFYHSELRESILMYDELRSAPQPKAALLEFCQSTYEAAANLAHWDRSALEYGER